MNNILLLRIGVCLIALLLFFAEADARIIRSAKARHEFMKLHPCPSTGKIKGTCPGYIIDHIIPLKRGGPDISANMQWQTREEAKAKDKWE